MVAPWDRRAPREHDRVLDLELSTWLPQVAVASPYWRDRTGRLGLEPRSLSNREDVARFDPVRELDVLRAGTAGSALVVRPTEDQVKGLGTSGFIRRVAQAIRRGGPEAKRQIILEEYKPLHVHEGGIDGRLAVAYSRSDLDRLHRAGARAASVVGLDDADYLVSFMPAGPHIEWWGLYHLALGSSLLSLHGRHEWMRIPAASPFERVPATAVAVATHEAVALAADLVEAGADLSRVRTVLAVGPPPFDAVRERIADAWRAAGSVEDLSVRAAWAPSEARALWVECAEGPYGLHTYPDMEILELVDPVSGEPTDREGDLTYTSVGWNGLALLRYRTGAYVEAIDREPCPGCGRTVPRLIGEIAPGAWQLEAQTTGEAWHIDFRGAADVLGRQPGLETWRVEMRSGDVLAAEVAGDLDEAERTRLEDRLVDATGAVSAVVEATSDARLVERHAEELGSVFADVR